MNAAFDIVYFDQIYDLMEPVMRMISLAEAKAHFSELVTRVAEGENIVITRHGQPIARLCGVEKAKAPLASRLKFRATMASLDQPSASLIRALRDEER